MCKLHIKEQLAAGFPAQNQYIITAKQAPAPAAALLQPLSLTMPLRSAAAAARRPLVPEKRRSAKPSVLETGSEDKSSPSSSALVLANMLRVVGMHGRERYKPEAASLNGCGEARQRERCMLGRSSRPLHYPVASERLCSQPNTCLPARSAPTTTPLPTHPPIYAIQRQDVA